MIGNLNVGNEKYKSDGVKLYVASFQRVPKGLNPHFTIFLLPQTITDTVFLLKFVMTDCLKAVEEVPKTIFLNKSANGVSCKDLCNIEQIYKFIGGSSNQVSLSDPDQHSKSSSYKLVCGSCADILGSDFFKPWFLKLSGIDYDLQQIDDFTSDLVFMSMEPAYSLENGLSWIWWYW